MLRALSLGLVALPFAWFTASGVACSSSTGVSPDSGVGTGSGTGSAPGSGTGTGKGTGTGTGTGTGVGSSSGTGSGEGDSGPQLSFATDIYAPIVLEHCIFCHGPTADGGPGIGIEFGKLDMSSVDAGYANLVNAPSTGVACGHLDGETFTRVVPGNPEQSLLYLKVHGWLTDAGAPCGNPMPKSGAIPDGGQQIVTDQIQKWIQQNAKP